MRVFKIIMFVFSVFVMLLFTGCQEKAASTITETSATSMTSAFAQDNRLFELELYSDKTAYNTTDKIKIWATLKYIGPDDQITIWHGDPYISFYISDGKDFDIGGIVHTVLRSTKLDKDKLYQFEYSKNGGYSADDPKADFWKEFYAEKDLYLPEGEYTVKVCTAFSLTEDVVKSEYNQSDELKITVK